MARPAGTSSVPGGQVDIESSTTWSRMVTNIPGIGGEPLHAQQPRLSGYSGSRASGSTTGTVAVRSGTQHRGSGGCAHAVSSWWGAGTDGPAVARTASWRRGERQEFLAATATMKSTNAGKGSKPRTAGASVTKFDV